MLSGRESEIGDIEPYVEVIHYCKGFREVLRIPLTTVDDDYVVNLGNYTLDPRPRTHITAKEYHRRHTD
ncbi:hypothetical protein ANCCAN_11109 [Ancylostoma caninum]|uniref:Transthyretin-like family protein n=1 Tax=Ancylostoma caninum TaxID=29170 RepID=A0A368GET2_ANCCA|nr:hypothetical protein ANCCAN_11109 [Ancylostoma caninum]